MDLCRIDLDERTRKEVRLLLVVALQGHGVAGFEQRLQCLDDGPGFQDMSLHPRRDSGQARRLLRPAAQPGVGLASGLNGAFIYRLPTLHRRNQIG